MPPSWSSRPAAGELSFHTNGHQYIDGFAKASLAQVSSAQVSNADRNIAGSNLGMLVLAEPCTHLTCASATVSELSGGGSVSGTLTVPYAFELLRGPGGAVVEYAGGCTWCESAPDDRPGLRATSPALALDACGARNPSRFVMALPNGVA